MYLVKKMFLDVTVARGALCTRHEGCFPYDFRLDEAREREKPFEILHNFIFKMTKYDV